MYTCLPKSGEVKQVISLTLEMRQRQSSKSPTVDHLPLNLLPGIFAV